MRSCLIRAALMMLLLFAGCTAPPPRLANTGTSPEEVASLVLTALAEQDRSRLEALALSESEFRDHVWPDLPAARPERNLPMSYVWGDLHQKSQIRLAATLHEQRGRRYTLESVTFAGATDYPHFRVHRNATFAVRDQAGAVSQIHVCGSMIEKDGAWKVFSYVID